MRPLERLVRDTIEVDLVARLRRRAIGWTGPTEIARKVLQNETLQWCISQLPREDPYALRLEVEERVRALAHKLMHGQRDTYGVRIWETHRVPGQREARWLPTRGMTVGMVLKSGQAKLDQGQALRTEGMLLIRMAEVGQSFGLSLDDTFREQYDAIAKEATRQITDEAA